MHAEHRNFKHGSGPPVPAGLPSLLPVFPGASCAEAIDTRYVLAAWLLPTHAVQTPVPLPLTNVTASLSGLSQHAPDYSAAARLLGVSQPRLTHLMSLALLAPQIQEAILAGTITPPDKELRRLGAWRRAQISPRRWPHDPRVLMFEERSARCPFSGSFPHPGS